MKKIITLIFLTFAVLTTITAPMLTSHAADEDTKVTLDSFNPFKTGGIKCLYYYKNTAPPSGSVPVTGCTANTGLLNRVEQLLFVLAPAFAIIGIMLGGYKMMQDGYDSKGDGIKTIKGSIVGLVIVLSAFFVRNIVYTLLNGTFTDDGVSINNSTAKVIIDILRVIAYQILIPIGSPLAVGFVIWGGYLMITAGGNPKKIDTATKTIKNAIIGFLVIIFAAALVSIAQNLLTGFFNTI